MARRKRTPEELARREQMKKVMKDLNVKDMDDIQDLFKIFVQTALEGGLEAELDEELGYSKYDYRNKETDNSRNGKYAGAAAGTAKFLGAPNFTLPAAKAGANACASSNADNKPPKSFFIITDTPCIIFYNNIIQ